MTTSIYGARTQSNSNTVFREWGSGTSAALAKVGMVQTADTGQVDWATVVAPAATNSYPGYEMWRFNDSLQATAPLYVKVEYGCPGGGLVGDPGIRWTVGKASNGSGGITGTLLSATETGSTDYGSTFENWYMSSGDRSMLCFAAAPTFFYPSYAWHFVIDRSRDSNGTPTATGVFILWMTGPIGNAPPSYRCCNYSSGTTVTGQRFPSTPGPTSSTASSSYGRVPRIFPGVVTDGSGNWWQPRAVVTGLSGDIGFLNAIDVQGFGRYLSIPNFQKFDPFENLNAYGCIAWY